MIQKAAALGLGILWISLSATAWAQTGTKNKSAGGRTAKQNTTPEQLQSPLSKADSLRAKLQKSTGLDVSGLDPSASVSLPGGKGRSESLSKLLGETIPDLGLKAKEFKSRRSERRRKAKKGRLARVQYEGIPMEKVLVKYGSGDRARIEEFHVLKAYEPISSYAPYNRWYDLKKKQLSSSVIKDKEKSLPLHGPYKRYVAGDLIEEGFFYKGTKDGRWVTYDANYDLIDKSHWYRGFPAESRITYYDSAHTKIKEVIPVQFGEIDGDYMSFYDEGQLMEKGKYDGGVKVGRWVEYYQYRRARKKEIQYRKSRWDEDFEPFVLREWDDKNKLIYDSSKDPRATAEVDDEDPK